MIHTFEAEIYKTGINWCVDVPVSISGQMTANRGRIYITGRINGFYFDTTLMPVKNSAYRLFVNAIMMKGGKTALGEIATFEIEQSVAREVNEYPVPDELTEQLVRNKLTTDFDKLTASRKKEILKYLSNVKTEKTLIKNIDNLISQLINKEKNVRIPFTDYLSFAGGILIFTFSQF